MTPWFVSVGPRECGLYPAVSQLQYQTAAPPNLPAKPPVGVSSLPPVFRGGSHSLSLYIYIFTNQFEVQLFV